MRDLVIGDKIRFISSPDSNKKEKGILTGIFEDNYHVIDYHMKIWAIPILNLTEVWVPERLVLNVLNSNGDSISSVSVLSEYIANKRTDIIGKMVQYLLKQLLSSNKISEFDKIKAEYQEEHWNPINKVEESDKVS